MIGVHVDQAWQQPLAPGVQGTLQTLAAMAELCRCDSHLPQVRDVALSIVQRCSGHDFDCEIVSLFEWVRDHITFRRDPLRQERVQDSLRTLAYGVGDCDDKSVILASLLLALGHPCRFVVIGFRSASRFDHVFVEALTKRGWLPLDPTVETAEAGWEAPALARKTFDILDSERSSGGGFFCVALGTLLCFAALSSKG